ncbi:calmodulin-regulated spectrin-associated protein 3 isoform X2 [Rana temporaria]|uniref:calmodulin-regulated spectrin-associated protein 3 isoform X2 n=1 Tax=Rana temporaria TaxID=8407 RepID=UPI001AAD8F81|nr:calmodulin-regulated spectrin-associated protein 3 isoform X2 [Rana temporaria]
MKKSFMVPEIKPLDVYDAQQARISASLSWLIYKSYGNDVPEELVSPCYTDQYEQEHVKPAVISLLLSADVYCRAYRKALPHDHSPPRDNAALLLLFARKGCAPVHQGDPVKTSDLREKPIRMSAHLAVIDSLMIVYSSHCSETLPASEEPGLVGVECKLLAWVDKINRQLLEEAEREQERKQQSAPEGSNQAGCPSRWYWKLVPIRYRKDKALSRQTPCFTSVSSIRDLSNGSALAATVHYYCPSELRLQDVCLKDTMSVADSLYNLQLLIDFYAQHLLLPPCPLSLEDLLYVPTVLRVNLVALLADLYYCFEVTKPEFVQPKDLQSSTESTTPTPSSAHSGGCSPVFNFRPGTTGSLPHSSSMSHMEGFGKSWAKNPLSSPLSQAVSFSIPFGLDSDVDIVMGNPVNILRSVSSDSLTPPVYAPSSPKSPQCITRATYSPPEDAAEFPTQPRTFKKVPLTGKCTTDLQVQEKPGGGQGTQTELPTIEEALQIIHSSETRLHPEGAPDGFYLHSPEESKPTKVEDMVPNLGVYRTHDTPRRLSRDDDSVLRDNSLDSDVDENRANQESSRSSLSSQADSSAGSGTKMTSFAERKKKLDAKVNSDSSPSGSPNTTTWAQKAEESPVKSPALNSEMNQLGARLEEKRRAIEAQKKRIEAIFAKHRQRLGKSAFLQLKNKEGEDDCEEDDLKLSPDEGLPKELEERQMKQNEEEKNEKMNDGSVKPRGEKQVSFSPEVTKAGLDNNLGDYNKAVAKLNTALSSLQTDMKRLSDQQDKMMKKESKAWVIPVPKSSPPPHRPKSSPPTRLTREFQTPRSSSASPSQSPSRIAPKSPQPNTRRSLQPVPVTHKSPKNMRPVELKLPPINRVLTPPHNVDTIPHLRKFSPSKVHVQTRSSLHFAEDTNEGENEDNLPTNEVHGNNSRPVASVVPQSSGIGPLAGEEREGKRSSLIEIPLSDLQPTEDSDLEGEDSLDATPGEDGVTQRGLGFFFKGEARTEMEMAQRRAALLERQQKRSEEAKKRKQWQEEEREKKEEAKPQEEQQQQQQQPRQRKDEDAILRRGDFTRLEYQRRHQLKIMEDLDKVLRQKPMTVRAVKKPRPKTIFNDDSMIARSPVRGLLGSKLSKVYSQSTMSLSTVGNENGSGTMRKSPRSPRAMSPSGLMSPSRGLFTQNGDKDWDTGSTASSPASIPEYTGPKLYKEPSAKSNKFIINNALSHCCLAGKVNETQKSKVLEDMDKSQSNHFLILFRDSSCQFRAVYTFSAETDELTRLAGFGPRTITLSMVEDIYKYSSDRKRFTQIPSKTMSMSVDAFTIQGHLWQTKRPTTPKKASTPK